MSGVAAAPQEGGGPAAASSSGPAAQLATATEVAVRQPGQRVRVRLEPDGLGAVELRVIRTDSDGALRIQVAFESAATRDLVQEGSSHLLQALERRGFAVEQLQVDLLGGQPGWAGDSDRSPAHESSQASRSAFHRVDPDDDPVEPSGPGSAGPRPWRIDYLA